MKLVNLKNKKIRNNFSRQLDSACSHFIGEETDVSECEEFKEIIELCAEAIEEIEIRGKTEYVTYFDEEAYYSDYCCEDIPWVLFRDKSPYLYKEERCRAGRICLKCGSVGDTACLEGDCQLDNG